MTARRRRPRVGLAFTVAVLAGPSPVFAHLVTTGLGPVYDGVSHVLMTLDDLLPIVGLAMLAGQNGAAAGRRALFALPAAWLAAGLLAYLVRTPTVPEDVTAASLLVVGGLTASGRRLPTSAMTPLIAAVGSLHGWLNGLDLAASGRAAHAFFGIGATIFVLVALAAALVSRLRAPWARIAVRVAGSWIAAVGLLQAGWSLR